MRNAKAKQALFGTWRFLAGLARCSKRANVRRLRARGDSPASLAIREATMADVPLLARLHVTTWNATYAPLLMRGPRYEIRERQWREAFAEHDGDAGWFCFVVERPGGGLVGFAQGGHGREVSPIPSQCPAFPLGCLAEIDTPPSYLVRKGAHDERASCLQRQHPQHQRPQRRGTQQ